VSQNDEAPLPGRPDKITISLPNGSTGGGALTPLQTWTVALADCLDDARAELNEREWSVFVSVACDHVGSLAARVLFAEIIRAEREEGRDAA